MIRIRDLDFDYGDGDFLSVMWDNLGGLERVFSAS
jgi:hypothetical protein